jgi:hypothetical protein
MINKGKPKNPELLKVVYHLNLACFQGMLILPPLLDEETIKSIEQVARKIIHSIKKQ